MEDLTVWDKIGQLSARNQVIFFAMFFLAGLVFWGVVIGLPLGFLWVITSY